MTATHDEFTLTILPDGIDLSCRRGETPMACAARHGFYWPTICGGAGECGACRCEIVAGAGHIDPSSGAEEIFFRINPRLREASPGLRLACCMTLNGPAALMKRGVKKR